MKQVNLNETIKAFDLIGQEVEKKLIVITENRTDKAARQLVESEVV